jgi:hypothetical protein
MLDRVLCDHPFLVRRDGKRRVLGVTDALALVVTFLAIGGYIESALMRADMGATADRLIRHGLPLRAGNFALAVTLGDKDVFSGSGTR